MEPLLAPISLEGEAWKVVEARQSSALIGGAIGAILGGDNARGALIGASIGAIVDPPDARIAALRQKAATPEEFDRLLRQEIENEIALHQQLGEIRPVYDPNGYRYITFVLYHPYVRQRGERVLESIMDSALIESGQRPRYRHRGLVLFETPYKKTFSDCIGLGQTSATQRTDEQDLIRGGTQLQKMAGPSDSPKTQLAIRTTCYDFEAAQRLMFAAGLTGTGPYLLTFDGAYLDRMTADEMPALAWATACPREVRDSEHSYVMAVRLPRDPGLDAAVVDILLKTLRQKDCRTPWLAQVRFEILDTLVRGSRVTRELAEGMVEIVGIAHAAAFPTSK